MDLSENPNEEIRRLRRTMREAVALSNLPAAWIDFDLQGIARSLADVLLDALSLDLVYVRLGWSDEVVAEAVRARRGSEIADMQTVKATFAPLLTSSGMDSPTTVADPLGQGTLNVAVTRFGAGDEGFLVAGSCNAGFPTELDRLLLEVAVNQTAIVVQRRRAEERAHEQQEWLEVTLASIGDAVITTDTEGRVTFLNPVAERLTGWTAGDAQGHWLATVFPVVNENTRQPIQSPVQKVLRQGSVAGPGNHTVLLAKDESERPIDHSAAPIRDATGKPIGVVLIFRDVTEQRRKEQHRNARLAATQVLTQAATVEDAAVGVLRGVGESLGWDMGFFWIIDDEDTALVCRHSWHRADAPVAAFEEDSCRRSFRRGQGLPGRVWSDGEPAWLLDVTKSDGFPRAASATACGLHSALACPIIVGDQVRGVIEFFTKRIREPDADLLEMMSTIAGHVGQFIERMLTEDQLRQSSEQLADFFENATVGLHWVGPDGMILRANQAELDMLGYEREEYVGHAITEFHADQTVIGDILNRLQAGERLVDCPARLRCKDGSFKDVLIDSSVLWKDGRFIHTRCFTRDVTERNRAESRVREQEQRTRIILESITDAFFAVDRNWRFTYANRQAQRLLDRKLADLLGHSIWDELPGLIGSEFEQAYRRVATERITVSVTSYYPDHDRWYEVHVYPATDGISVYFRDVSLRKAAEAELVRLTAASEQQRRIYETALSNTADFNYVFDLQGRFVYVNKALLALWGKRLQDAVGKNFFELDYPPVLAERLQCQIRTVIETRQPLTDETPYTSAAGERQYEYIFMPVVAADGSVEAVAGSTRDITDRKRLEEELRVRVEQLAEADRRKAELLASLRESEEKLRLLADTIPQLAWMARPDGHIFWYNRRWYEYTGTTPEQMVGWGWRSVHDPAVLPKVLQRWRAAIASGEPIDTVFPLKGADGQFRPFLTRVNPLRDQDGRILYWFGTNTDISEIKMMEQALRDADRRKDEFLATLAHELRNPLAPLRNALHILNMRGVDADAGQQFREMMSRQLDHLVRLVDDLLDVSRVMRGKIELRKERVELASVVARAVETAQPLIELQGHTLDVFLPPEPLLLDADPVRLAQVVGNLLTNAAKYTEAKGRICLDAERQGNEAVLRVRDHGIGIAPDMLPRVFDLFVQADHAPTKAHGGLGIGLTLVKNLVEMHHGTVRAHSAGLDQGSEFVVRLPLMVTLHQRPVERRPSKDLQHRETCGHRLLVVDDNEDAAKSLAMLLRLQGHDVRVAHDGPSALELAAAFHPRVVFLDIGMPRMDGYEVARQLRGTPGLEDLVLAALTGWGQQEDRRRSAEAGFHHHLVKPPELNVLERLLAEIR